MRQILAVCLLALMMSCDSLPGNGGGKTRVTDGLFTITDGEAGSSEVDLSIMESRANGITTAVKKVSPAVVTITVTQVQRAQMYEDPFFDLFFNPGAQREFTSSGSGFIISEDGYVVTNEHVASRDSKRIQVTLADGREYPAVLVGTDEFTDLALLKITDSKPFPYLEFGDSDNLMVGEWAIAVGNPFGLFEDGQPTVTVGVVSALKRDFRPDPQDPRIYLGMIQTDAAINRGNSGGPLVNSLGHVIGINTFIYTGGTGTGFVGLGFAIPSNRAIKILNLLAETGEVSLTYDAGFEFLPINRVLAYQYNLPTVQGLFVVTVNRDGPAYEAGILPGDIILRIGDEAIHGAPHAWALFREYNEGDTMRVEVIRERRLYETRLKLRQKVVSR
jgi:serine protease Do